MPKNDYNFSNSFDKLVENKVHLIKIEFSSKPKETKEARLKRVRESGNSLLQKSVPSKKGYDRKSMKKDLES